MFRVGLSGILQSGRVDRSKIKIREKKHPDEL